MSTAHADVSPPLLAAAGHQVLPLHGRVAIVTGGAGGIGAAISSHLASLGAHVVVGYIGDPAPSEQLVASLNGAAVAVWADVSDPAQVARLFDAAQGAFGVELHIVVAAAGVQDAAYPAIADTEPEQWDRVFAVNARGTFLCCREAARRLVRDGRGRIVTFSSSNVASLRPGYGVYVATKAAVEAMTRVLAKELAGTGITANSVATFYAGKSEERVKAVANECPMKRIGDLCSDAAGWMEQLLPGLAELDQVELLLDGEEMAHEDGLDDDGDLARRELQLVADVIDADAEAAAIGNLFAADIDDAPSSGITIHCVADLFCLPAVPILPTPTPPMPRALVALPDPKRRSSRLAAKPQLSAVGKAQRVLHKKMGLDFGNMPLVEATKEFANTCKKAPFSDSAINGLRTLLRLNLPSMTAADEDLISLAGPGGSDFPPPTVLDVSA